MILPCFLICKYTFLPAAFMLNRFDLYRGSLMTKNKKIHKHKNQVSLEGVWDCLECLHTIWAKNPAHCWKSVKPLCSLHFFFWNLIVELFTQMFLVMLCVFVLFIFFAFLTNLNFVPIFIFSVGVCVPDRYSPAL